MTTRETIIVTLIVLGIFIYIYVVLRRGRSVRERAARSKIQELKKQGLALSSSSEVPLTESDKTTLRRIRKSERMAILLLGLAVGGLSLLAVIVLLDNPWKTVVCVGVALVIFLLFFWLERQGQARYNQWMTRGLKTVIRGVVTDKTTEGEDDDVYFLVVDSVSIRVKKKVYRAYQVGDSTEIHFLPGKENLLLFETKLAVQNVGDA